MFASSVDAHLPRRMLPVLQILALACLGLAAMLYLPEVGGASAAVARSAVTVPVLWTILLVLIGAVWWVRARTASARMRAGLSVAVVLLATPVAVVGRVGFTIPVLLLAVALVVLDISLRAGLIAMAWISGVGLSLHTLGHEDLRTGFGMGLMNTIPVAVLLCFGVVLGATLRAYEERLAVDAQRIERLHRAAETEKELLLADERARSARELHDGLGHRLTLVSMSLDYAERMRVRDAEAAWAEVSQARTTSQEALTEMRTWVRALSPVRDPSARGAAALEAIADSFRGTGLEVQVRAEADADAVMTSDDAISLLAYRTVQEGLTKALRHGRAHRVRLDLGVEEGALHLRMSNDLAASAVEEVPVGEATYGFGLRGITERAVACGGHVTAVREGEEFVLDLRLPAEPAAVLRAL